MWNMRKILAPTDLSELSLAGIRYAFELAAETAGEVIVFHVIGYQEAGPVLNGMEYGYAMAQSSMIDDLVDDHRKQLDEFLGKHLPVSPKIKLRQDVVVGAPYEKIIEKAAAENVDAIVISTHGRTGLVHALLGSVAEKVVRLAKCPVLTVRPTMEKAEQAAA
ncbi:MAG TPA: universal stress protein [Verrucomicrobiae bacterium]|jgi:nucleotide-binding universal stress UspA family protein|nr:universal stress protein [Verrucomicrobiae bacterium]